MRPALAALLVLLIVPAAARATDLPPKCPGDASARCGSVRVPLHRSDPGGEKLRVRYRVIPRSDRSRPAGTPIVATEGGPGYSTVESGAGYEFMLRPLLRARDLIVMDNRGTGRSGAIDCPRLQAGKGDYTREVGRCAERLGAAADAYGTGAAADDLAAVLDALDVPVVSLYGDSYGTYFAQAFAVRHPDRVNAVVLDAAFAVDGFDPWARTTTDAIRAAWTAVCGRSRTCPATDPVAELGALAERFAREPLVGRARDADGARHPVRMDGAAFGQLVNDAGYGYAIYRDVFAAARALDAGDPAPMLRLAAEDLTSVEAGPVKSYSEGAYAAVACHDYPAIWNVASSFEARRAELDASRAALPANAFAPFSQDVWLNSLYEHQLVYGCLRWPAPAVPDPPAPPGAEYPDVPVLVLNGDLDVITPMSDATRAAALFPNATLVPVGNAVHVTALADFDDCAARIVRDFIRARAAGDTRCASTLAELHVVPAFPRTTARAPAASPAAGDRSNRGDRRGGWAAAHTVADAMSRWWLMYGYDGRGLRGGTFETGGDYYAFHRVTFRFAKTRFVRDLAVSGRAAWNRRTLRMTARLKVAGARGGRLRIAWPTGVRNSTATVRGTLGGRTVRLTLPAP
ncbi:MAG: alpha/beta fold hydrolase [Solirubrobacteraceae bacterium]